MDVDTVERRDGELDLEQRILAEDDESAGTYLRATWLYRAMEAIRDARLRNGLTQQDVAERMGTTQSAIARLENAHRGTFSLDRFLEYAWACGVGVLDLDVVPADELRRYAAHDPAASRTAEALRGWRAVRSRAVRSGTNVVAAAPASAGPIPAGSRAQR